MQGGNRFWQAVLFSYYESCSVWWRSEEVFNICTTSVVTWPETEYEIGVANSDNSEQIVFGCFLAGIWWVDLYWKIFTYDHACVCLACCTLEINWRVGNKAEHTFYIPRIRLPTCQGDVLSKGQSCSVVSGTSHSEQSDDVLLFVW